MREFVALSKNKVIRKAINFWYQNFSNDMSLKDFFSKCIIKKINNEFIIRYED